MSTLGNSISIKETIDQAMEKLSSHEIESPEVVCELLLRHVLKCRRIDLYLNLNQQMTQSQLESFYNLLKQRLAGKPVQYIINSANFFGLELYVDENVLIPRPETEILVEAVLRRLSNLDRRSMIIDWGTGSGNIAIALASHLDCEIYAVDVSEKALQIAQRNILTHSLESKIKLVLGDSFTALANELRGKVDAVVSNPPYVKPEERNSLPQEVRDYEPKEALFDKKDGLYFTGEIILGAKDFLKPEGLLALEVALGQAEEVRNLIGQSGNYKDVETELDLVGIERVVLAQKK